MYKFYNKLSLTYLFDLYNNAFPTSTKQMLIKRSEREIKLCHNKYKCFTKKKHQQVILCMYVNMKNVNVCKSYRCNGTSSLFVSCIGINKLNY